MPNSTGEHFHAESDSSGKAGLIREIIYLIRRLMQADEMYTKELSKRYQVSGPQLHSLLVLHEYGPLPLSQVAKHIMVKSSTVTGIIDRLEQKGLVTRVRRSPDRRVITIELTDAGRQLAQNAPPPIQQKIVEGLDKLQEAEVRTIVSGLGMLVQMLDVQDMDVE